MNSMNLNREKVLATTTLTFVVEEMAGLVVAGGEQRDAGRVIVVRAGRGGAQCRGQSGSGGGGRSSGGGQHTRGVHFILGQVARLLRKHVADNQTGNAEAHHRQEGERQADGVEVEHVHFGRCWWW